MTTNTPIETMKTTPAASVIAMRFVAPKTSAVSAKA